MIAIVLATVFSVGVEAAHDKTKYHFENPSAFDANVLVPHFFEQEYSGTKPMLIVRARGARWEIEGGASTVQTVRGSDYDTFFQPSGDVVVHGYTDDVRMRSWRTAAYAYAGMWRVGLAYSRDQSKFPPTFTTTTHTNPPSTTTSFTDTRETTRSDVVETRIGFERHIGIVRWGIDAAPLTVARLTTSLPDKYPAPVRFSAPAFTGAAHLAAEWQFRRIALNAAAEVARSWHYGKQSVFMRQQSGVSVAIGLR